MKKLHVFYVGPWCFTATGAPLERIVVFNDKREGRIKEDGTVSLVESNPPLSEEASEAYFLLMEFAKEEIRKSGDYPRRSRERW